MPKKPYKVSRGLFKMPSDDPPKPAPVVLQASELCEECRKRLTKKQIRAGSKCCSYKCSNRRKARLYFKGVKRPKRKFNLNVD